MNRFRTQRGRRGPRPSWASRRGIVSVLAMMFLVLFGSLVAAMAITSQGNTRAASTHLHVMRASGAAETGLAMATQRLREAASRFVVATSTMDGDTVNALWLGNTGSLGEIVVLDPPSGHSEAGLPEGIAEAVALLHAADESIIAYGGLEAPVVGEAPAGTDAEVYKLDGWVYTPLVSLEAFDAEQSPTVPAFQVTYAPLANGVEVRAIVTGFDFAYTRNGQPLQRTIMKDFRMIKRVNHAVIAPTRVMIGKNVHIEGDLGIRYDDVDWTNGDPLVLRSDFLRMDEDLDDLLAQFYAGVAEYDVNGDGRLRVKHAKEKLGIPEDEVFTDVTKDGYVDEFDVFINFYDANGDGRVALSDALRNGTPHEGLGAEFVDDEGVSIDEDLAKLIDWGREDRNRNGVHGFEDSNGDGLWDPDSEPLLDYDEAFEANLDQELGWRDGVIDALDAYTKVNGSLTFRVHAGDWESAQGDFADKLWGAIKPERGHDPLTFEADDNDLPLLDVGSFASTETALQEAADGEDFWVQVADQLGVDVEELADYEEDEPDGTSEPRYFRLDPDADYDGLPDNWAEAHFEKMPFNSPAFSDWYYRPVFENMAFKDTQIPEGLNALFVNCTFAGVTYVRAESENLHVYWSIFGRMQLDPASGRPKPEVDRVGYGDDAGEEGDAPPMLPGSAVPPEDVLMLATIPMDKGDILESAIPAYDPDAYASLPEPLVIDGKRVHDTRAFSNNIRFHDCLFVGSIVGDTPEVFRHVRNKVQFTGKTRFVTEHPIFPDDATLNPDEDDLAEIAKSSMMLANFSVDVGTFNSPPEQDVVLHGAVIAGVLDVRGNATIDGALLLTFQPVYGEPPMVDPFGAPIGNPSAFNTTLGYFGPDEGDLESLDPADLPIVDGVKIVGWDTDGDGLADVDADEDEPPGGVPVPFYGYGRIELRFNPDMAMPDGIMLPLQMDSLSHSYREGAL